MPASITARGVRRIAALILLPCYLAGCYRWQPSTVSPGEPTDKPNTVMRVTLADGSDHTLGQVWIAGDTLHGFTQGWRPKLVSLQLSDIQYVEVRRTDPVATTAMVVLLTASIVTAIVVAANTSPEPPPPPREMEGCPLVYSWDGSRWRLDSGTFGAAIAHALARTDVDLLEYARPDGDRLRLRLTTEQNETDYTDALSVLAVDHAPGVGIAPDGDGVLHSVGPLVPPRSAHDFLGRDALARVRARDDWNWESVPSGRDSARLADVRDGLELVFPRPHGSQQAKLVVDGESSQWAAMMLGEFVGWHGRATAAWYDSVETQPAMARGLATLIAGAGFLSVSVWDGARWRPSGYITVAGPEVAKRQVAVLDLSDVHGDDVRVRLEGTPSFWLLDRVAMDYSDPQPFTVRPLALEQAVDDRGRDVSGELGAVDGRYYVTERGDGAELSFRAPPLASGMARSWVLRSTGWYRPHTDETGEPQTAILDRVMRDPLGAARIAVARASEAILASQRTPH